MTLEHDALFNETIHERPASREGTGGATSVTNNQPRRVDDISLRWVIVLIAVFALSASGCEPRPESEVGSAPIDGRDARADEDEIRFGVVGSLTGPEATFGTSMSAGIEMAVRQINESGGLLGKPIRLIVYDNRGQPTEAAAATNRLIVRDRIHVLLGEVASSRSMAMAAIAETHGVPMISSSSTHPKVTLGKSWVFRVCFIDPFQGTVMARFAKEHLGLQRIAVMRDVRNDYSMGLSNFFIESFRELGGEIVDDLAYSAGDIDFSAQLTTIRGQRPDGIFVPGYYTDAALLIRQARQLGLQIPILGGDGWDSAQLFEIAGEAVNGTYYANHFALDNPDPRLRTFLEQYREVYGGDAPDAVAALGYDAAQIAADAIRRAGSSDRRAVRRALEQTEGFPGVTGAITIDEHHNAVKPAVVLKVVDRKPVYHTTIYPPELEPEAEPTAIEPALHPEADPEVEAIPQALPAGGAGALSAPAEQERSFFSDLLQHLINGLSLGAAYALIALGYTMVYGVLQFINFAHAEVFMLGAFAGLYSARWLPHFAALPRLAVILGIAMSFCALLGVTIERLAYRPLRGRPRLNTLITAIGVSMLIQAVAQLPWFMGPSPQLFPELIPDGASLALFGISLHLKQVAIFGAAILLMAALHRLVFHSKMGAAMRAVAFDGKTAALMGIDTNRIIALTFIIGSTLAAAAGILVGIGYPRVDPTMGVLLGLKAFVAAVLGGIGNIRGAMVGGLVIGLIEALVSGYGASTYRDAIVFGILILVLVFRPAGLFGKAMAEKV